MLRALRQAKKAFGGKRTVYVWKVDGFGLVKKTTIVANGPPTQSRPYGKHIFVWVE